MLPLPRLPGSNAKAVLIAELADERQVSEAMPLHITLAESVTGDCLAPHRVALDLADRGLGRVSLTKWLVARSSGSP